MGRAEMLQSLHESPAHMEQMESWREDRKAFEALKADYENQLGRVSREAYEVATMYAAFQGVIFIAVSQPNLLTCGLWWSPVALSLAVSAATFFAIADKLYNVGELKEDVLEMDLNIAAIVREEDAIECEGIDVDLETAQPRQERLRDEYAGRRNLASKGSMFTLFLLSFFSTLIASFCKYSLCNHCSRCN